MTTKERNQKWNQYILACIDSTDYFQKPETEKEKIEFLADCWKREYLCESSLHRYGSYQAVLREWFTGLPSCFGVLFYNSDILLLAKEFGINAKTEAQEDKVINDYWNILAHKVLQLFRKYKIDFYL